jgi:Fe-S-cluster-containing hydrogenase component 2
MDVCPQEALHREMPFGPLAVDRDRCATCFSCILPCPFEVLHLDERGQAASPCDLCAGEPECVKACPEGALVLADMDEKTLQKKRGLSAKIPDILARLNDG